MKLKALRELRRKTQRQVSIGTGISQTTIWRAERGQDNQTHLTAQKIADYLEVEPEEIDEFKKLFITSEEGN